MHFFYLDESGDSGCNLDDAQQPIFVLAGLSVADKKWNNTKDALDRRIDEYFYGDVPDQFELHSHELLSPNGEGPFEGHELQGRLNLAADLLNLINELGHHIHFYAVDKTKMNNAESDYKAVFDLKNPYLLSFEYLVTYMNWHVKNNLGQSGRGMIVLDEKEEHHESIESIIHNRRYDVAKTHKVKWIVEFSYPVNSRKSPMIQLSDLVALCVRRFLEIELGYKDGALEVVKKFYAECFNKIDERVQSRHIIERGGRQEAKLNDFISSVQAAQSRHWRRKYDVARG